MDISYCAPAGVEAVTLAGRPVLSTVQGGKVVLDSSLFSLWRNAQENELERIL